MALPASGPISMSQVMTELQNTGTSTNVRLSYMGSLSGSGTVTSSGYVPINRFSTSKPLDAFPQQLSEWYNYNHSAVKNCPVVENTLSVGNYFLYYAVNVTGSIGAASNITLQSPGNTSNTVRCNVYTSYPFTNTGTLTGTPVSAAIFTNGDAQYYNHTLASTSETLYFVIWSSV